MKNENIIQCRCGGHLIELYTDLFPEYGTVDIMFWYLQGAENNSLWARIKTAWKELMGNKAAIYDIVLDREELTNLKNKLDGLIGD